MPRPKAYAPDAAVRAALELFWERGYEATSLSDLEKRTGLNRSSLYQEFGSKRQLFERALRHYVRHIAAPTVAHLGEGGAGLADVAAYLRALAETLRQHPDVARHGCMMVNTVTELGGQDPTIDSIAVEYRTQLTDALTAAMVSAAERGDIRAADVRGKSLFVTAAVMGILVNSRLDPTAAADLADTVAAEVLSWGRPDPMNVTEADQRRQGLFRSAP